MKVLYKVVKIEGKGRGCIALVNIKKETLILQEKPQCVVPTYGKNPDSGSIIYHVTDVIEAFGRMTKIEKKEYLKLYNNYTNSVPNEWTLSYNIFLQSQMKNNQMENNKTGFVEEFILEHSYQEYCKVIGIYFTNFFGSGSGLGIQASRFNHSCCSNADAFWNHENSTREIRAMSNIKKGEEIFINYFGDCMGDLKSRQLILSSKYGFKCNCECCQSEILRYGRYDKFFKRKFLLISIVIAVAINVLYKIVFS